MQYIGDDGLALAPWTINCVLLCTIGVTWSDGPKMLTVERERVVTALLLRDPMPGRFW